jgi:hypothetical protein
VDATEFGFNGIASGHDHAAGQCQDGRTVDDNGRGLDDDGQPRPHRRGANAQHPFPALALGQGRAGPVGRRDGGKPLDLAAVADPVADPVADRVAAPPPAPAAPKQSSETARVELTIDSLRNYEIIKPIPVFVESLGERHFVAEVPDLNITTSASNLSEILIVLKDNVTQTYDRLRIRKSLDAEETRQLKLLETYIGKSRRSWLDRR